MRGVLPNLKTACEAWSGVQVGPARCACIMRLLVAADLAAARAAQEAYVARHRAALVAANPTASPQALAGMLARQWRDADGAARAAAEADSAADKARCASRRPNRVMELRPHLVMSLSSLTCAGWQARAAGAQC